jgi:Spy/CpxP family protein refolding chaperone
MTISCLFVRPVSVSRRLRVCGGFAALVLSAVSLSAQADESRRRRPEGDGEERRRAFDPQELQARMMNAFRERLGVQSDDEWAIISERLMKVMELRRAAGGPGGPGFIPGRGSPGGGGDPRAALMARAGRGGGSPEGQALQQAIADKLPDAEIKARLTKLRETRKKNETELAKAQEDLRAVLTIRQEALAVVAGLLP